ncbi:MAG TPA: AI-2E family transporter [Blastococcus sp.]|nr:AI-2E family transporter [Blastococcus sp.]
MTTPVSADGLAVSPPAVPAEPGPAASPEASSARRQRRLDVIPRSLIMLLGAGAAVLVLGGIRATSWLIAPAFLALMIVIALYPVQAWLRRHDWPDWLTTLVLVFLAVGVLASFVVVVVVSLAQLAALLPQYADRADDLLASLAGSLSSFDVAPGQLQEAVSAISPDKVVALIGTLLAGLSATLSSLIFLLCLMLFLSVDAGGIERRLAAIAPDRPELESALRSFAHGTRSYLLVSTVFGLIVGVLDGVALAIIGVPLPVLWAVLAFITNYIPNVGFVIGVVPPALLALLTLGLPEMLVVIAVYCVLNFVIQSLIQPRYVGDSVGLATTTTFVALVFWAWLLGPLGALLAIPLTLLVKALLVDVDPSARWATALAGSLAAEPRPPRRRRTARAESPVAARSEVPAA